MKVFIFGLGYSAMQTVAALRDLFGADLPIAGTTRSSDKARELLKEKLRVHAFDGRAPGFMLARDLTEATHLIISIPPHQGGDAVLAMHRKELLAAKNLEWICYYSTVGVYGDADGAWIDEKTQPKPGLRRTMDRVQVEKEWQQLAIEMKVRLSIFRIAGIYGPGRSQLDKLRDGTARRIIKENQVFNRIHVADLARLTALAARDRLDGIFNIADDEPAPPQDAISYAAELAGLPLPPAIPFEQAELSDMARSFYSDNKRVSNAAIKKALGVELRYPSYRSGLNAIFDREARGL